MPLTSLAMLVSIATSLALLVVRTSQYHLEGTNQLSEGRFRGVEKREGCKVLSFCAIWLLRCKLSLLLKSALL